VGPNHFRVWTLTGESAKGADKGKAAKLRLAGRSGVYGRGVAKTPRVVYAAAVLEADGVVATGGENGGCARRQGVSSLDAYRLGQRE
jgi:hypothetical protein